MEKRFRKIGLFVGALFVISVAMSSCNDNNDGYDYYGTLAKDVTTIDSYLAANSLSAVKDPLGLRMVITELGTGLPAMLYDTVNVDYVGRVFSNNSIFDSNTNIQFPVQGVIDGWQVALLTLPAGSTAKLFIPSPLAYGDQSSSAIPANSILVFDMNFNNVVISNAKVKRYTADTTAVRKYINDKKITGVIKDASGIFYKFDETGSGPTPTSLYDKVSITYGITLMSSGTAIFSDLVREPSDDFYSRVVDYIHAIKIALMKMPVGTKATLYVPSGLGFGSQDTRDGAGNVAVPANSNLIVTIKLTDID